jgi:hypothetical protein
MSDLYDAAFPRPPAVVEIVDETGKGVRQVHAGFNGMTLRQWYAGLALSLGASYFRNLDATTPAQIAKACEDIAEAFDARWKGEVE